MSGCAALCAAYTLKAGVIGAFMAIARGFALYGGLNVLALLNQSAGERRAMNTVLVDCEGRKS